MKTSVCTAIFLLATLLAPARAEEPPSLTLEACLRESLQANHTLLVREAESVAAGARADAATANRRPRLGLLASAVRTSDPLRVGPATDNNQAGIFARDTWQASAVATLPLYTGGRLAAEQAAQRLLAEAAVGDLEQARALLAYRIVAVFEDALATRAVLRSLHQSRETLAAQLDRIDALLKQQKAAEVDRLRVAVRLARVEQDVIEARSRLETLQSTLAVLMGRDPETPWELVGDLNESGEAAATEPVEIAERPDERAARIRAAAALEQERAAKSARLPSVDAVAAWGPRADFAGRESYESGFVGVTLNWNVWDFGRTSARMTEARAQTVAREHAAAEVGLQRRLELATARAALRSAVARIGVSRLAVEQAREGRRIEQRKYDLGEGTVTDVLDALAAEEEAESLRARALADHAIAQAACDYATGHIFSATASLAALRHDPVQPTTATPSR